MYLLLVQVHLRQLHSPRLGMTLPEQQASTVHASSSNSSFIQGLQVAIQLPHTTADCLSSCFCRVQAGLCAHVVSSDWTIRELRTTRHHEGVGEREVKVHRTCAIL